MIGHEESIIEEQYPRQRLTSVADGMTLLELGMCDVDDVVNLINFNPEHLDAVLSIAGRVHPESIEDFIFDKRTTTTRFGIWESAIMRGLIEATEYDDHSVEIGYWIGKEHTGKRFASRAQRLLADFLLTRSTPPVYLFNRIAPSNTASIITSERSGFRQRGVQGDWLMFRRYPEDETGTS